MLSVDEDFFGPQAFCDLFPRDQLPFPGCQQDQQFQRLPLHAHRMPPAQQLKPRAIKPEIEKLEDCAEIGRRHGTPSALNRVVRKNQIGQDFLLHPIFTSIFTGSPLLSGAVRV